MYAIRSYYGDFLRFRFRFLVFPERMWLFPAFALRIPPLPVAEKRFDAPRLLFIFGITVPPVFPTGTPDSLSLSKSFPRPAFSVSPIFFVSRVSRFFRITSYNVCYTKLLREPHEKMGTHQGSVFGNRIGEPHRVGGVKSEQVCMLLPFPSGNEGEVDRLRKPLLV